MLNIQYLSKGLDQNMLKTNLSTQFFSLSVFIICKTHKTAQKPHGRHLEAKVCGSECAIFVIHYFVQTTFKFVNMITVRALQPVNAPSY